VGAPVFVAGAGLWVAAAKDFATALDGKIRCTSAEKRPILTKTAPPDIRRDVRSAA